MSKMSNNDWMMYIVAGIATVVTIVGNYIYHGGHLVW